MRHFLVTLSVICVCTASVRAKSFFVNWEAPQVHPLALTPDGIVNAFDLALLLGTWGACE